MSIYRALVLDPDTCLRQYFERAQIPNVTLSAASSAEQLFTSITKQDADFVMLHLHWPGHIGGLELIEKLRKKNPTIPAILLANENPTDQVWRELAAKPWIQLMQMPVTPGELQFHLARLFEGIVAKQQQSIAVNINPVSELRNDASGRLDANKIANVFNLTMSEVAACVGRPRSTLVKTPDSLSVQAKLRHFERIADGLLTVTGSMKGLKMWLNSPAPSLEGHTPVEVLKHGKLELLAGWVDEARLGSPD